MKVYLDNSATTPPSGAVVAAMTKELEEGYFNPSSLYRPAMEAEKRLDECRGIIAGCLHALPAQVYFTGSGTEADNIAVIGHMQGIRKPSRILYLAVEHPAVREACLACERMGHKAQAIPVDHRGVADLEKLKAMLTEDVAMLCIMQVNNETGAIQPLREIAALRDACCPQAHLHVDGIQGFLKVPVDMTALGIQSYALSGHKIHGPKGIGALVLGKGAKVSAIQFGGGQEKGLRSGTENTPGVAGLQAAIRSYPQDACQKMAELKERLYRGLVENIPSALINGPDLQDEASAPHILNLSLMPVRSDTMLFALEGDGIFVSSGSACSSHQQKISSVLKAMGVNSKQAESAVRFSFSPYNTPEEIDYVIEKAAAHYRMLSRFTRR